MDGRAKIVSKCRKAMGEKISDGSVLNKQGHPAPKATINSKQGQCHPWQESC
jgi:hypothetical protein